ncbi:class I SAM-dependent methyltransferase [Nocardioides nanhaiensis]|uniref:Class I SAM-dependent methyltransferase n=1 Tax=Nocardioides nanhaiensis TaxID=1476871 RepID=A0ABP8W0Q6_9ACTN
MTEEVRELWDAQADAFDDEPDHGLRDPDVRAAWAALLTAHLLAAAEGLDVVDLGCGTGSLAVLLAEAGHRVRGLDLSPAMVEQARAKVEAHGVGERVSLAVGDAADPPGEPGSADLVLCRHVLWALPDPSAALARWVRLLRPGGRLLLVEGSWHTGAGLTGAECRRLVLEHRRQADVVALTDPALWGGPISDERYLVVSRS